MLKPGGHLNKDLQTSFSSRIPACKTLGLTSLLRARNFGTRPGGSGGPGGGPEGPGDGPGGPGGGPEGPLADLTLNHPKTTLKHSSRPLLSPRSFS